MATNNAVRHETLSDNVQKTSNNLIRWVTKPYKVRHLASNKIYIQIRRVRIKFN
jgi:hypothetical protein